MRHRCLPRLGLAVQCLLFALQAGCRDQGGTPGAGSATRPAANGPTTSPAAGAAVLLPPASLPAETGLHHLHVVDLAGSANEPARRIISGSMPQAEADFADLAALGVRTIVSVDGATPDVARAKAHGMRYVHMPVEYQGIDAATQTRLAKVVRDLPGPVYFHCHHGLHRGPAAVASAAVLLGAFTPEQAEHYLTQAGTSKNYPGLYACVREARPVDDATLAAGPAEFPEVAEVGEFVEAMVAIDHAFDHLQQIQKAGWQTPPDHPDLVPAAEAGRLAEVYRQLRDRPEPYTRAEDFAGWMSQSATMTAELEARITEGKHNEADLLMKEIQAGCTTCHRAYRNAPRSATATTKPESPATIGTGMQY